MKQNDALNILRSWDIQGRYVFRKHDLAIVLDESGRTLDQTLARLKKAGVLERPAHGGEYRTPYGVIEFTHTKQPVANILPEHIERESHALPLASKQLAYANLRSVRRNLDLVDEGELHAQA